MITSLLPYPINKKLYSREQHSKKCFIRGWIIILLTCIAIIFPASGFGLENEVDLLNSLREGSSFVLLRHALAPGTGDPDYFLLENCMTQRNLSDAGREQATAIGNQFQKNHIQRA